MPRSVLITGGNRGLGLATALAFAQAGDRVAVACRSGELPEPLRRQGCIAVRCDVTDGDQVDKAVEAAAREHGPAQVLVANAGITRDRLLPRMTDEDFTTVLDTNLVGAFRAVRAVTAEMLDARGGRIVLVSSFVGLSGAAGQANYAASKAGLVGFARAVAREVGSRGITCNVVAPGPIESDMTSGLSEKRRAALTAAIPLGRWGAAQEVAAAVKFLASEAAGFITGAVLPVDGGMGMGH